MLTINPCSVVKIALTITLLALSCVLAQPSEILIGTEMSPLSYYGPNRRSDSLFTRFLHWGQSAFPANNYFLPDLTEGGFTYDCSNVIPELFDSAGCSLQDALTAADDLKLYLGVMQARVANPEIPSDSLFNSYLAWVSEKTDTIPVWHEDFFLNGLGNAGIDTTYGEDGQRYRSDPTNPGGFIIGNPSDTTNELDNNWCCVPGHFMFYPHGWIKDNYRIWFLMKLADNNVAADAPIMVFHMRYTYGEDSTYVYHDTLRKGNQDSLIFNQWHWVQIQPPRPFNSNYKEYRFALQWLGKPDSGEVKFARIAYQSERNWDLYGGDNEELSINGMEDMVDDLNAPAQASPEQPLNLIGRILLNTEKHRLYRDSESDLLISPVSSQSGSRWIVGLTGQSIPWSIARSIRLTTA